ncbi:MULTISPECIES: hypothetical protein [unclassified Treponema]|uniref:hypothetical protein n=1 Tax=unclassified Treponema TaxID=2638727 RepID=UPI0020A47C48|nr:MULTISPECIES: hypothetical protein [unclassified Treponema]UTC66442.1 hypothetical protein E4O06_10775 [Treponema sp. OMZ 789]UTC69173.1 hypothetical protein E4O01_10915 [Treponema sp. OMZ 790]UTC71886.1 hypothetical protein E4O02_11005 [Treponema sp. OMZ 791]
MDSCFNSCTSLTQGPDIPALVTNMKSCFSGCSALKEVKLNCPYTSTDFRSTFFGCTGLKAGGIQVPSAELETYKTNAAAMGTTEEKFAGF